MQKGNIKVRRSLNRCAEKENVADLNLNNLSRDRNNFSIPSLTMRPSKLLPHLEPTHQVRKLVQKRSKPHQDDMRKEIRKASVTMVTNASKPQSFKHITLSPIVMEPNQQENLQLMRTYGQHYLTHTVSSCRPPSPFLRRHGVNSALRARMLDWMIEVMASFRFTDSTLFQTAQLMDRFFAETQQYILDNRRKQEAKDLHCIGVVSMFIASKLNEVYPLRMKTLYEKIVHKKVAIEELRDREADLMRLFGYCFADNTTYDTTKIVLATLRTDHLLNKKHTDELEHIAVFVLKMTLFDYGVVSEYSQLVLVEAALTLAAKLYQHQESTFETDSLRDNVETLLRLEQPELVAECCVRLEKLVRGFDRQYPGLTNLRKFNKLDIPIPLNEYDTL